LDSVIAISYPWWYIGLCLLLGFVYAFVLYFKDKTFKDASKFVRRAMGFLSIFRFLAVSALAFLLLMPLLKNRVTEVEQPIVIYAQDNSESIGNALKGDTTAFKNATNSFLEKLKEKYEVHSYQFADNFSDELNYKYDEKVTNLEEAFRQLYDRYTNQNVGAIVMATDGIYNEGSNPVYTDKRLNVPVYSIALGDTTPRRDLKIERVYHNKIAYLRDKFTIRVDVHAYNCDGESTTLNVFRVNDGSSNTKAFSQNIRMKGGDFTKTVEIILDANVPGINQYSIQVNKVANEVSTKNNVQNIFVDILDSRQKILILANAPHPDISAIKSIIEKNENYETTTAYIRSFTQSISAFDLVVLHGLPSNNNPANAIMQQITDKGLPALYILSNETNLPSFNGAQTLLQINGGGGQTNMSKAEVVPGLTLFTLDDAIMQNVANLPPITTPFGEYAAGPNSVVLLKQKIGSISTDYPLLVIEQSKAVKRAVFAGEGLWRWKLYDFQPDNQHETIQELFGKTLQYLAVKNDKRQFRISTAKNLYYENESITFDAELYNDSYELINESDASLTITDAQGKEYAFIFNKTGSAYRLDAGIFPVGKYSYKGKTVYAGNAFEAKGNFNVIPRQLEALNTTANHQLLYSMAERTDGKVFYMNNIDDLQAELNTTESIKPILFSNFATRAFINLKWLFFVILAFLAIEWFIRKFNGGY